MPTTDVIEPGKVHSILNKHMLTDGYGIVLDLEKSRTPFIRDARSGDDYLDFYTFFASNPLGMNHPGMTQDKAFHESLHRAGLHKPSNSDTYTQDMAKFVDTFDRVGIPDYLPHLFLISGGTLAVENALKVAFDWKVQKNLEKGYKNEMGYKVLHLKEAFHGRSGYTLSLTNSDPVKTRYYPKFNWPRIPNPALTFPLTEEGIASVIKKEKEALEQAERYFNEYEDDIACIILEPIQGEGGDNHFRPEFHQALRKLADKHDVLLIYDEVQTGVGLTGRFWAHEYFAKPDIIAFGKKSQVCGILASDRIDEVEKNCFNVPSRINSTWGGSLIDMVRFNRLLEIIEKENLVTHAAEAGSYLQKLLDSLAVSNDAVSNPRGKGLFCAIDLPDKSIRDKVIRECSKNRLIIMGCGTRTIRFRTPLTITPNYLDQGIEILDKSIQTVLKEGNGTDT